MNFIKYLEDRKLLVNNFLEKRTAKKGISRVDEAMKKMDFAVSLGGDGTLLRMARYMAPLNIPVMGVNFGRLGFLTEVELPQMQAAFLKIRNGDYTLEKRGMLHVQVFEEGKVVAEAHDKKGWFLP